MMYGVERLDKILHMLSEKQALSTHEIAKTLYISEATVRRDLIALEKEGMVKRIHGGVIASAGRDVPIRLRESEAPDSKSVVGALAAALVKPGDTIMLDASTTCNAMVRFLPQGGELLVITSGLKTAVDLCDRHIRTMVTGGSVLDNSYSLVGFYANLMVGDMTFNTVFCSCRGITRDGRICGTMIDEIQLRRVMARHAKRIVLLITANKIGQEYYYNFGTIEDVDEILCDVPLPPEWLKRIGRARGKKD